MDAITCARRVRALLELRGWTVRDLAERAGIPHRTVIGHMAGKPALVSVRAQGRDHSVRPPLHVYAETLGVDLKLITSPTPWSIGDVRIELVLARGRRRATGPPTPPRQAGAPLQAPALSACWAKS